MFRHYVANRGLESEITADSAGTHGYQFGDSPDPRAVKIAQQRGYDMGGIFCRKIERKDFTEFDFVLAMDHDNLAILNRLRPADSSAKLSLLMQYCKGSTEAEAA